MSKINNNLLMDFARAVNSNKNPDNKDDTVVVYGTVSSITGDGVAVKLDDSNTTVMTPASTVAKVREGDRVTLNISKHSAVIIGNNTDISAGEGGYNLLPTVYHDEDLYGKVWDDTDHGIKWTVNLDGSVTATGTAVGITRYLFCNAEFSNRVPVLTIDPTNKYVISGCPSNEDEDNPNYWIGGRLYAETDDPSGDTGTPFIEDGSGVVTDYGYKYICAYAQIKDGYACPQDGITFYPMLEPGEIRHSYASTHDGTGALAIRIGNNETNISIMDGMISAKVSANDIINQINLSQEGLQIDASKININGAVTANEYFKINTDGSVAFNEGTLGGLNVDPNGYSSDIAYSRLVTKADVTEAQRYVAGSSEYDSGTPDYIYKYDTDKDGDVDANDVSELRQREQNGENLVVRGQFKVHSNSTDNPVEITLVYQDSNGDEQEATMVSMNPEGIKTPMISATNTSFKSQTETSLPVLLDENDEDIDPESSDWFIGTRHSCVARSAGGQFGYISIHLDIKSAIPNGKWFTVGLFDHLLAMHNIRQMVPSQNGAASVLVEIKQDVTIGDYIGSTHVRLYSYSGSFTGKLNCAIPVIFRKY